MEFHLFKQITKIFEIFGNFFSNFNWFQWTYRNRNNWSNFMCFCHLNQRLKNPLPKKQHTIDFSSSVFFFYKWRQKMKSLKRIRNFLHFVLWIFHKNWTRRIKMAQQLLMLLVSMLLATVVLQLNVISKCNKKSSNQFSKCSFDLLEF